MLEGLPFGPQLSAWIILFMLIVARLSFVIFLMPGIGDQTVPARVRVSLLLGAATLFAMSGIVSAPSDISIANY
jgi:flagellar biosynthetic protein FliR